MRRAAATPLGAEAVELGSCLRGPGLGKSPSDQRVRNRGHALTHRLTQEGRMQHLLAGLVGIAIGLVLFRIWLHYR